MRLVLPECVIRSYASGDEAALVRHADNPHVAANMRDRFPSPYRLEDARAWIAHVQAESPITSWAIEVEAELVGGIGIVLGTDVSRRSAEIGYWLGEAVWGRGIATAAVRAVSEHALRVFDLCRLYACVFEGNLASARVLEKAGYVFEGRQRAAITKRGRTLDALMYARVELGP